MIIEFLSLAAYITLDVIAGSFLFWRGSFILMYFSEDPPRRSLTPKNFLSRTVVKKYSEGLSNLLKRVLEFVELVNQQSFLHWSSLEHVLQIPEKPNRSITIWSNALSASAVKTFTRLRKQFDVTCIGHLLTLIKCLFFFLSSTSFCLNDK